MSPVQTVPSTAGVLDIDKNPAEWAMQMPSSTFPLRLIQNYRVDLEKLP